MKGLMLFCSLALFVTAVSVVASEVNFSGAGSLEFFHKTDVASGFFSGTGDSWNAQIIAKDTGYLGQPVWTVNAETIAGAGSFVWSAGHCFQYCSGDPVLSELGNPTEWIKQLGPDAGDTFDVFGHAIYTAAISGAGNVKMGLHKVGAMYEGEFTGVSGTGGWVLYAEGDARLLFEMTSEEVGYGVSAAASGSVGMTAGLYGHTGKINYDWGQPGSFGLHIPYYGTASVDFQATGAGQFYEQASALNELYFNGSTLPGGGTMWRGANFLDGFQTSTDVDGT